MKSIRLLNVGGRSLRGVLLLSATMLFAAPAVMAGDPIKGGKIYNQQCKQCHGSRGKSTFPGVADFSRGEGLMMADHALLKKIRDGRGMMPAFRGMLKDDEIFDVITYLRKLHR
ncbi:MAG: cytochrome c [Thiotrichaceae bacterium]|nr:cytochrome c [Thiotrichaceae bacterium]